MSMVHFVRIDRASGLLVGWGTVDETQLKDQEFGGTHYAFAYADESNPPYALVPIGAIMGMEIDLAWLRAQLIARIDQEAGEVRAQFITVAPGQEMTYMTKWQEAKAWASGNDPETAPFLKMEAEMTDTTIDAIAALVLATVQGWLSIGPKIEGARRRGNVLIDAAATSQEACAAAQIDWPAVIA